MRFRNAQMTRKMLKELGGSSVYLVLRRQGYEMLITICAYLFEEQKTGDGKKNW